MHQLCSARLNKYRFVLVLLAKMLQNRLVVWLAQKETASPNREGPEKKIYPWGGR